MAWYISEVISGIMIIGLIWEMMVGLMMMFYRTFVKSEHNEALDDQYHGQNGPLNVAQLRHDNPFTRYFVEAGSKHHKTNNDFNGSDQEGVAYTK